MYKILAISGSLRKGSYNTALLWNLQELSGPEIDIHVYEDLDSLPLFNPDSALADPPRSVLELKQAISQATVIILSVPEYAHGVPGAIKNALDWLVSAEEMVLKPVAVMSVSTSQLGGFRSLAALIMVLNAMNTNVIIDASVCVPFAKTKFDTAGRIRDKTLLQRLNNSLVIINEYIQCSR